MSHPNRPNRGVTLVKLLGTLAVTGVLAAGVLVPVIGGVGLTGKAEADRFLGTDCTLQESAPSTKTNMFASDGTTLIAQFFAQNRIPVQLAQIPKPMQQALIDTEDRRFYDHHGVDARGLLRAAANNSESGDTQGGSTLTMQYVKQLRLYNAKTDAERTAAVDQNIDRKIQDAKCAIDLEKRESKDQILQNYFNIAFFGQNSYGVQAAAQTYFSADVSALTLPQAAMIVGLVQAPSQYDPFTNPDQALERRNTVIDNMVTAGDVTATDAEAAKATPLGLSATTPPPVQMGCSYTQAMPAPIANAGFFCDYAVSWLQAHGISEDVLLNAGLNITTTLDAGLQTSGQNAVWTGSSSARGGAFDPAKPSSLIMPSLDPRSGNVTTMITSRRYTDPNNPGDTTATSVPLFTTAASGSGSTFKYFTTLLAMQAGVDANYTLTAGAPYTTKNCPKGYQGGSLKSYTAVNAGNYAATLSLDKALYESSNTYFVGMEDMLFNCYTRPIADLAVDLGISSLTDPQVVPGGIQDQQATFTLGQDPVSPLALSAAYATVANDGVFCPPTAVTAVTDQSGQPVEYTKEACSPKIAPQIARNVVQILEKDTDTSGGTATGVFSAARWYQTGGSSVASKTGTNNATTCRSDGQCVDNGQNSAIWFVGMTPTLVSTATVLNFSAPISTIKGLPGYSDGYASGDAFGAAAGAYWIKAYGDYLKANPWSWPSPNDVPGVAVPSVTGKTAADATATLQAAGFQVNILPFTCGSRNAAGTLIGYNPKKAQPGDTITACVSNGKAPTGGTTSTAPRSSTPTNRAPAPGGGPSIVTDGGRPGG